MCNTSFNCCVLSFRCHGLQWGLLLLLLMMMTPAPNAAQQPTPTLAPEEFMVSTIEDLVGIWEMQCMGAVAYMQYEADGTLKLARSLENLRNGVIAFEGRVWFEGTVFYIKDPYGQGTYEARMQKEGNTPTRLTFIEIDDPNAGRTRDMTAGMTWVAPSLQALQDENRSPERLHEQYAIYLPEAYDAHQKSWPLLLFLHGGRQQEPPPTLLKHGKNFPVIIVAPRLSIPNWSADFVDSVLDDVTERYRVDDDRIYVTGVSMGGFGTWTLAVAYPNRFAAIAPISGGGEPDKMESISHLPVWVFHGAKDDTIPIERAQDMVDALENVGGNVTLTIYPDAGHDVWTEAYDNPALYEWFLTHQRGK